MHNLYLKTTIFLFYSLCFSVPIVYPDHSVGTQKVEEYIPAHVDSVIIVRDIDRLKEKIANTPYAAVSENTDYNELANRLKAQFGLFWEAIKAQTRIDIDIEDIQNSFRGDLAVAIRTQSQSNQREILFLIETEEQSSQITALLNNIIENASAPDKTGFTVENIAGRKIYNISLNSDRPLEGEDSTNNLRIAYDGQLLAVLHAEYPRLLETHIGLVDGDNSEKNLAGHPYYKTLHDKGDNDADYLGFKNLHRLWESVSEDENTLKEDPERAFNPAHLFRDLGLFSLKASLFNLKLSTDGIELEGHYLAETPPRGVFAALAPSEIPELGPPSFVRADAALYGASYLNVPTLWSSVQNTLENYWPQIKDNMQIPLEPHEPALDIEKEIVETFADRLYLYLPKKPLAKTGNSKQRLLNCALALDLKDARNLKKSLDRLFSFYVPGLSFIKYGNAHVMQIPTLSEVNFLSAPGYNTYTAPALAILDDTLFIAANTPLLLEMINDKRRKQSPLITREYFQNALRRLRPAPATFVFADMASIGEILWQFPPAAVRSLDIQLPDYAAVKGFMSHSALTVHWGEHGPSYKVWIPYPDPSK